MSGHGVGAIPPSWLAGPRRLWSPYERVRTHDDWLPLGFFSFWDIVTYINLSTLAHGLVALGNVEALLAGDPNADLPPHDEKQLGLQLAAVRSLLVEMEMETSVTGIDRLIEALGQTNREGYIRHLLGSLLITIKDEMRTVVAFQVQRGKLEFLRPEPCGPEVKSRFPSADYDIGEAGKCLALWRTTAAVYHLMRVLETGLRALGASLNDSTLDPRTNPSWEKILGRCDKELQKPLKDRSPEWRTDAPFFATATANLRVVKEAWRNPTMHVERRYNEEEAREVWNATRAFMRHLATKLSELS